MSVDSAELYDAFYEWKDYPAEAARLTELIDERVPSARTLLDVACGTGVHLELLRDRFDVEGLDPEPLRLAVARRRLPDVPLHEGDMRDFDLMRTFDVVTCLFSSIGYMGTVEDLRRAVANMARHVRPGGLLIVEPWLSPDAFEPGRLGRTLLVERPDLAAVRMNSSRVEGRLSVMDFHYLVSRPGEVSHFVETHALGLYTDAEYQAALSDAGLSVEHDPDGLMGRGLYLALAPA